MDPSVGEGRVLLLGGLALGVAVRGGEVPVGLGGGGPEEGAGVGAREVHGDVAVPGHGRGGAGGAGVVHEDGGVLAAGLQLGAQLPLERLVGAVVLGLDARGASFGGNALRHSFLDHFQERLEQRLDAAVLHLVTVVFILVHRVVGGDNVFVVGVVRHVGEWRERVSQERSQAVVWG